MPCHAMPYPHLHLEGCFEAATIARWPKMRGVALVGEYALCRQSFGWTDAMANTVATTSIDASFASADVKARLFGVLEDW